MKKFILLAVAGAGLALTGSTSEAKADHWRYSGYRYGSHAPGLSGYSVYSPGLYGYRTHSHPAYGYGDHAWRHRRHDRGWHGHDRHRHGSSHKGISIFIGDGGLGIGYFRFRN
ncbi:MAG TPA: hypothetical protein VML55_24020 [Planctomycetaceae bacterium]|nr:hypothetical protein [Planctomycetaceae bacterium]